MYKTQKRHGGIQTQISSQIEKQDAILRMLESEDVPSPSVLANAEMENRLLQQYVQAFRRFPVRSLEGDIIARNDELIWRRLAEWRLASLMKRSNL